MGVLVRYALPSMRSVVVGEVAKALPYVFVSCVSGFPQAHQIGSVVPASPAELGHFLLEGCGDVGKTEDLVGERV